MSVELMLDPASVDETVDYLEQMRLRIFDAARQGMLEAMQSLAMAATEEFYAAGMRQRSGALFEAIEKSPRVTVKDELVRGTVASDVGRLHIGLWLEEGVKEPAVAGKLFEFTEPDAGTLYSRGHRAFDIKPHPFLNPALRESETLITETINQAVEGALAA